MSARVPAFFLAVVVAGCATAGGAPSPATTAARPAREVLQNGLVLIVHEHRASGAASVEAASRKVGEEE